MKDVIAVYRRIVEASRAHRGIRLSREDVFAITCDGAVQQAIDTADDEEQEEYRSKES